MTKRDFLRIPDLSFAEARTILDLAKTMKSELAHDRAARVEKLRGRACGILMEKASTRTRVSFEVGAAQLGMHPVVLTTQGSQLARGEPVADTARVLSRYVDLLVFRTSTGDRLAQMAKHASVPVINALTDDGHPVQVLCDVFTIEEHFKKSIEGMRVAWIGDCASNMARSFVEAASLFGFEIRLAGPVGYVMADHGGAHFTTEAREALLGADVVCTDVWASMGQEADAEKRAKDFRGWTLDEDKLAHAKPSAIVLHCLPAHRGEEITADVLEGPRSHVWDQAENRLHVQKALMTFLLEGASR
jgi:ornithine carbamoyltransferase